LSLQDTIEILCGGGEVAERFILGMETESGDSRVNFVFDLDYYKANGFEDKPVMGLGSGDSYLILNVLPPELLEGSFERLDEEIEWNVMNHKGNQVPRLISIQGDIEEDGKQPLYRHPADEQPTMVPWTPFARVCRDVVANRINQALNHALIQKYRSGRDNIGEHADKTLDIELGSAVVNLSLGASRVMILKPKQDYANSDQCSPLMTRPSVIDRPHGPAPSDPTTSDRIYQKITLPHNSVFVLGWQTNRDYLHSIRQDKRQASFKRPDECLHNEARISLTFRLIATFIDPSAGTITGQGAMKRERWEAMKREDTSRGGGNEDQGEEEEVSVGEQSVKMLAAFSSENRLSGFEWEREYGCGFSIVNFSFLNHQTEAARGEMMDRYHGREVSGTLAASEGEGR
jgi:alkylated DNA repair dioxygenase AlkB